MIGIPGDTLPFDEIRNEVAKHLKTALKIEDFKITLAVLEDDIWRINVSWDENVGDLVWPKRAALKIDAKTGTLREFRESYSYSS